MTRFVLSCLVVVGLAGALTLHAFNVYSAKMDAEMRPLTVAHPPELRPLHHGYHMLSRVKATPKNKGRYAYWCIDPGDGYLWSAWWIDIPELGARTVR